nr:MAG TPA: hypothetical protein [Caudoviricetes sp.]
MLILTVSYRILYNVLIHRVLRRNGVTLTLTKRLEVRHFEYSGIKPVG